MEEQSKAVGSSSSGHDEAGTRCARYENRASATKLAHEYATRKASAYIAKFKTRGVRASAADAVYLHAYTHFRAEAV